jgi:hypothetical protein
MASTRAVETKIHQWPSSTVSFPRNRSKIRSVAREVELQPMATAQLELSVVRRNRGNQPVVHPGLVAQDRNGDWSQAGGSP